MQLPSPRPNPDSLPYWEAARERRLLIRHCWSCGARHFMPRHLCPQCWSDKLEWIESTGAGSVYSFSIVHRAPTPDFATRAPYVIAMVELDEGPRMFANIIGNDALSVSIGDRVQVAFEDRGEGALVPQFRRATQGA
jgi:uncharacterized OB-fold protein